MNKIPAEAPSLFVWPSGLQDRYAAPIGGSTECGRVGGRSVASDDTQRGLGQGYLPAGATKKRLEPRSPP